MSFRKGVPLPLRARAYSLAKGWLDQSKGNGPTGSYIECLYDAGNSANEAVALGVVSEAALFVAEGIESAGFRRPEDNKYPEHSTERFERLTDLWEVLDARDAKEAKEKLRREDKLSKDPLAFFCAAADCGIMATKRSTLRKCGGECPRGDIIYCNRNLECPLQRCAVFVHEFQILCHAAVAVDQEIKSKVLLTLVAACGSLVRNSGPVTDESIQLLLPPRQKTQGLGEERTIFRPHVFTIEALPNHDSGQLPLTTCYHLPKLLDLDPVVLFPARAVVEGRRRLCRVVEGFEIINGRVQIWFRVG